MIGLGENFNAVLDQIELVRRKQLMYTIFKFQDKNTTLYEIKDSTKNPEEAKRFTAKKEEDLQQHFEEFKSKIKNYGCCYSIFDFETTLEDGTPRSMIFLIALIPDSKSTREEKFLYASHTNTITNRINIAAKLVQINSYDDLSYEYLKSICLSVKKG